MRLATSIGLNKHAPEFLGLTVPNFGRTVRFVQPLYEDHKCRYSSKVITTIGKSANVKNNNNESALA
jgi:hypothetical protein